MEHNSNNVFQMKRNERHSYSMGKVFLVFECNMVWRDGTGQCATLSAQSWREARWELGNPEHNRVPWKTSGPQTSPISPRPWCLQEQGVAPGFHQSSAYYVFQRLLMAWFSPSILAPVQSNSAHQGCPRIRAWQGSSFLESECRSHEPKPNILSPLILQLYYGSFCVWILKYIHVIIF